MYELVIYKLMKNVLQFIIQFNDIKIDKIISIFCSESNQNQKKTMYKSNTK